MGQAVPQDDLPGSLVPSSDMPQGMSNEDKNKYKNYPISTFAANAVNKLTFGLPEYLNQKFTPEQYAEGQRYQEANPLAANLGSAVGEGAAYAVPTVGGIYKGGQLGAKGAEALIKKFGPDFGQLGRLYGKVQGGITGGSLGGQAGAALPGIVKGEPGEAVAGASVIDQIANKVPFINHLGPITQGIVPAGAAGAAAMSQQLQNLFKTMMQYEAAQKVINQGPQQ